MMMMIYDDDYSDDDKKDADREVRIVMMVLMMASQSESKMLWELVLSGFIGFPSIGVSCVVSVLPSDSACSILA
jgi:hypothetical protein